MAKPYIKLDNDWMRDPKVLAYKAMRGKGRLVDVVLLFNLLGETGGSFSIADKGSLMLAEEMIGKKGKHLASFFDDMAEVGIISKDAWESLGRVGSPRSIKDAEARANRRNYAIEASKAAAEKRSEAAENAAP